MTPGFGYAAAAVCAVMMLSSTAVAQTGLVECDNDWHPRRGRDVEVRNIGQLERAVASARPGDTIVLADGEYRLRTPLDLTAPNVVVRGRSGNRDAVVLRGGGMVGDTVGVALSVSASDIAIADLTVKDVRFHGVQVRGERDVVRFVLHNVRLQDTGQQLLKVSTAPGHFADAGLVACSDFSYTESAPSDYTNGVDLLAGKDWVIRDNTFTRIRGPVSGGWSAGPSILVWKAAENTIVERNTIVDSFRGIALGLESGPADLRRNGERELDHKGGTIRRNVIVNLHPWADEAIEANAAKDVVIEQNSVLVQGQVDWSIAARFASASATVVDNLTNRAIFRRNGGRIQERGNVTTARPEWFADPTTGDLRLSDAGRAATSGSVGAFAVQDRVARVVRP